MQDAQTLSIEAWFTASAPLSGSKSQTKTIAKLTYTPSATSLRSASRKTIRRRKQFYTEAPPRLGCTLGGDSPKDRTESTRAGTRHWTDDVPRCDGPSSARPTATSIGIVATSIKPAIERPLQTQTSFDVGRFAEMEGVDRRIVRNFELP